MIPNLIQNFSFLTLENSIEKDDVSDLAIQFYEVMTFQTIEGCSKPLIVKPSLFESVKYFKYLAEIQSSCIDMKIPIDRRCSLEWILSSFSNTTSLENLKKNFLDHKITADSLGDHADFFLKETEYENIGFFLLFSSLIVSEKSKYSHLDDDKFNCLLDKLTSKYSYECFLFFFNLLVSKKMLLKTSFINALKKMEEEKVNLKEIVLLEPFFSFQDPLCYELAERYLQGNTDTIIFNCLSRRSKRAPNKKVRELIKKARKLKEKLSKKTIRSLGNYLLDGGFTALEKSKFVGEDLIPEEIGSGTNELLNIYKMSTSLPFSLRVKGLTQYGKKEEESKLYLEAVQDAISQRSTKTDDIKADDINWKKVNSEDLIDPVLEMLKRNPKMERLPWLNKIISEGISKEQKEKAFDLLGIEMASITLYPNIFSAIGYPWEEVLEKKETLIQVLKNPKFIEKIADKKSRFNLLYEIREKFVDLTQLLECKEIFSNELEKLEEILMLLLPKLDEKDLLKWFICFAMLNSAEQNLKKEQVLPHLMKLNSELLDKKFVTQLIQLCHNWNEPIPQNLKKTEKTTLNPEASPPKKKEPKEKVGCSTKVENFEIEDGTIVIQLLESQTKELPGICWEKLPYNVILPLLKWADSHSEKERILPEVVEIILKINPNWDSLQGFHPLLADISILKGLQKKKNIGVKSHQYTAPWIALVYYLIRKEKVQLEHLDLLKDLRFSILPEEIRIKIKEYLDKSFHDADGKNFYYWIKATLWAEYNTINEDSFKNKIEKWIEEKFDLTAAELVPFFNLIDKYYSNNLDLLIPLLLKTESIDNQSTKIFLKSIKRSIKIKPLPIDKIAICLISYIKNIKDIVYPCFIDSLEELVGFIEENKECCLVEDLKILMIEKLINPKLKKKSLTALFDKISSLESKVLINFAITYPLKFLYFIAHDPEGDRGHISTESLVEAIFFAESKKGFPTRNNTKQAIEYYLRNQDKNHIKKVAKFVARTDAYFDYFEFLTLIADIDFNLVVEISEKNNCKSHRLRKFSKKHLETFLEKMAKINTKGAYSCACAVLWSPMVTLQFDEIELQKLKQAQLNKYRSEELRTIKKAVNGDVEELKNMVVNNYFLMTYSLVNSWGPDQKFDKILNFIEFSAGEIDYKKIFIPWEKMIKHGCNKMVTELYAAVISKFFTLKRQDFEKALVLSYFCLLVPDVDIAYCDHYRLRALQLFRIYYASKKVDYSFYSLCAFLLDIEEDKEVLALLKKNGEYFRGKKIAFDALEKSIDQEKWVFTDSERPLSNQQKERFRSLKKEITTLK